MAEFQIDGRMRVDSLQKQFKEAFGGTLRVYYHHHLAEAAARLTEIRGEGAPATGELAVKGSMKVSTFEEKMMEQFGIEVQVADAANEVLINNDALRLCGRQSQSRLPTRGIHPRILGRARL